MQVDGEATRVNPAIIEIRDGLLMYRSVSSLAGPGSFFCPAPDLNLESRRLQISAEYFFSH